MKREEKHPFRPYVVAWFALVLLLGLEILVARTFRIHQAAPIFGLLMAAIVAMIFMNLRNGSNLSRVFAIAGVFWLVIMLGIGILDPATRTRAPVPIETP